MKRNILLPMMAICLLLTGCSWLDGNYVSITLHEEQRQRTQEGMIFASGYQDLMLALEELTADGVETAAINVADYPADAVGSGMAVAVRYVMETYPIGAYAVDEISYELGTSGGQPALAVTINYRHSLAEIQRIRSVADVGEAESIIAEALKTYESGVVVLVEDFSNKDFAQFVQDYALENPQTVMETPQVTVNVYGTGQARVVELIFTYQNSRDSLRQMQSQVKPVFDSASLYVSGDGADRQKYAQLYAFLMERFDYTIETSITPAYSLLRHGVGDSRAFATVYAAMCRSAGLECKIITGTHAGEPRTWNMVLDNRHYYHVDLISCNALGSYKECTDGEMSGYVWDYSAYPRSTGVSTSEVTTPEPSDTMETAEGETEVGTELADTAETAVTTAPEENNEDF